MQTQALIEHLNAYLNAASFKDYAPNGLQVEGKPEIHRIVLGVSASQALIDHACSMGADCILVHHGWFWKGERSEVVGMKQRRLKALLKNDINLIAYHLPLDAHEEVGNNAEIARVLGLEIEQRAGSLELLCVGRPKDGSVPVEDLTKHKMDSEQMFVEADAVQRVNAAKDGGHNVCAVGTTVMRAIETAVGTDGHLKEYEGWTNKFIFPPYEFSVANSMVSNFHMPYSTLLMLVSAYGGYDLIMHAYDVALQEDYRFGTYGDAMLILD